MARVSGWWTVMLGRQHEQLTTEQAADVLNVSRPFLISLLETGQIEYWMTDTHRRIRAGALLEYKARDDVARRDTADELTRLAQEMDLL